MTTTRTDAHAPSSPDFDPEAYECLGVFDNDPEWSSVEHRQTRVAITKRLRDEGYKPGPGSSHQCGHCGAAPLRYAALLARADVREYIYVGETCLDNRFESLTKVEFQALREAAKLNRERVTRNERIAAAVEANPVLAWLTYVPNLATEFGAVDWWAANTLTDIADKFNRYVELSDKQVAFVDKLLTQIDNKATAQAQREAANLVLWNSGVKVPTGKVTVFGEIVSTKVQDSQFGISYKMLVQVDEGWKVWGTIPSSLIPIIGVDTLDELRGKRVTFTATVEPSEDDQLFGFYKRPIKASLV